MKKPRRAVAVRRAPIPRPAPTSRRTPRKTKKAEPLENNPAKSYKPSSDADGSDLETSHKC